MDNKKAKETQTNRPNNQPKPTKSDQSVKVKQVKHGCALTTWCIAQKPRLSQHLQQLVECHTSNNWMPCGQQLPGRAQGVTKAKANTLTSRPGSMKVEKSSVPVWQALAYLIQIKQKCLTRLYPGIATSMSE